ncbi:MAG: hypothetical protein IPL10_07715 [Bacteroidetes bacterium]|nr:hypothetical protein [Bacteroidota bacterium]
MKKIISFSFITALLVLGVSCKKEEAAKLTEFDISYSTNLTIPSASMTVSNPSLTPTTVEFTTPNVPTQQAAKFSAEGTAKNLIDQIKMTKFDISVSGAGANLDFLKSLTVYIKASGVGEQMVSTKTNIPAGLTSVSMDLQDVNIKDYIFQDNIQFRVVATFDATAATDQVLKMDETVHVKATLIK